MKNNVVIYFLSGNRLKFDTDRNLQEIYEDITNSVLINVDDTYTFINIDCVECIECRKK